MRDGGTAYRYMVQHGIAGWAMIWVWASPDVLVVERVHGLAPALINVASAAPAQVVMASMVGARVLVISRWQLREGAGGLRVAKPKDGAKTRLRSR
jgi:hypothetical protein